MRDAGMDPTPDAEVRAGAVAMKDDGTGFRHPFVGACLRVGLGHYAAR